MTLLEVNTGGPIRISEVGKPRGRSVSERRAMAEAMSLIAEAQPKIVATLTHLCVDKEDREACIYLMDRVHGRPKQTIDGTTSLSISLSADKIMQALDESHAQTQALLDTPATEVIDAEYTQIPPATVPDVAQYTICDTTQAQTTPAEPYPDQPGRRRGEPEDEWRWRTYCESTRKEEEL